MYHVNVLSARGGNVQSNSAVTIATESLDKVSPNSFDTILIAGGDAGGLRALATNQAAKKWARKASAQSRRFGSVCSGAFVLGEFGLIDGKRVATHWDACSILAKRYPAAAVDASALYVVDGRLWTSAGVTTGIDMCLEMVARDAGSAVANAVAKRLVLYARRPGNQSQFSPILTAQSQADEPFSELINWINNHLAEELDVSRLATRASMSERSFHRKFTASVGVTPAHFVETLRLDRSRDYLAAGLSLKEVAAKTGYSTAAQLSKAFNRRFGVTPSLFREMHVGQPHDHLD
jgi:transcriptional regulator GlxA family with amidase domain